MCRDGVIDATIDQAQGWLVSTEVADVYSTEEPQNAFYKYVSMFIPAVLYSVCMCVRVFYS